MIYFCIPAYNEERTVGVVLWKLRQVMGELQRDYQIIVVDDASSDSTPAVLSPYIRVLPLTVIRNTERRGYTDSLELAVREALRRSPYPKRDAVIVVQADFTEDPDVLPVLLKRFEAGADLVATDVELEADAPRALRWGRRFLRWVLRKHEWSQLGDPLSGLRAYRVIILKRALEARAGARLLTWDGAAANVELLAQAVPHARRSDVVATTLKLHRLQRPSRYAFMNLWRAVRGVSSGRPAHARALPTDSAVAQPLPIAVEPQRARTPDRLQRPKGRPERAQRTGRGAAHGVRTDRGERKPRSGQPQRTERVARPERPERPARGPRPPGSQSVVAPESAVVTTDAAAAAAQPARVEKKRRKRPRRRKGKRAQDANAPAAIEQTEMTLDLPAPPAAEPGEQATGEAPARKKSRRGRRGGRGRRRGPRPDANNPAAGNTSEAGAGGEAPPPPPPPPPSLAFEGE